MRLVVLLAAFYGAQGAVYDRPSYICLNKAFPGGWLATDPSTITQASVTQFIASLDAKEARSLFPNSLVHPPSAAIFPNCVLDVKR